MRGGKGGEGKKRGEGVVGGLSGSEREREEREEGGREREGVTGARVTLLHCTPQTAHTHTHTHTPPHIHTHTHTHTPQYHTLTCSAPQADLGGPTD